MKKFLIMNILLCLCLALFSGCSSNESSSPTSVSVNSATIMPGISPQSTAESTRCATLFFRYRDEPFLAAESRNVSVITNQPWELTLLNELLKGPEIRSAELEPVFPSGLKIVSTSSRNRTLFVTLSQEILDKYSDEPVLWQADEKWSTEVPLRRQLCLQSIVATITENCSIDRVQFLVEQTGMPDSSLRLRESYFMLTDDDSVLSLPQCRDESFLMTPENSFNRIFQLWQSRDWQRLFPYVIMDDTFSSTSVNFSNFVTRMEQLPKIKSFSCGSGYVNIKNCTATFSFSADILYSNGANEKNDGCIIHLNCVNNVWKVSIGDLTDWMEAIT